MRMLAGVVLLSLALGFNACSRDRRESRAHEDNQQYNEKSDEAARKAGKAAHELANKTDEAAKKAARELQHMAGQAREGWKEADRPKDKQ